MQLTIRTSDDISLKIEKIAKDILPTSTKLFS